MKFNYLLLVFLLTATAVAHAQIRHVKGIKSVDLVAGKTGYGIAYQLAYVKYFSPKLYGKLSGFYEQGEDAGISYVSYGLDICPAYTLLKAGEGVYINGIAGLSFSVDQLIEGGEEITVPNTFKYGTLFGVEIETYLHDRIIFLIGANQRFLLQDNFGNYRYFLNAGLRFNF